MTAPQELLSALHQLLPVGVTTAIAVVALIAADWLLRRRSRRAASGSSFGRHLVMLLLTALALVCVFLTLPVEESTRGQLFALLGLVLTAIAAVSSTTFVANAMAGLMLRAVRNFSPGDFIRVGDQFGRVTERGLFHTEIQTEDRDLTTLPNLYLVSNPVNVVRSSGTIISTTLSLGYDVPHAEVEPLLEQAARAAELEKPFVHVVELGNFAVTYRVAGFLANIKEQLSARSRLRASILDTLHGAGIEIVSPTFMNQRRLDAQQRTLPTTDRQAPAAADAAASTAESLAFDKAERAAEVEAMRAETAALGEEIKDLEKRRSDTPDGDRESLDHEIEHRRARREALRRGLELVDQAGSGK